MYAKQVGNLDVAASRSILDPVSQLLRTMISLAFLVGVLWFAFSVPLGGRTFAEHIDRISETPEAHDLIEGTRATVNPVLHEATDRMLGEHIEAPIAAQPEPKPAAERAPSRVSTPDHVKLPGQG